MLQQCGLLYFFSLAVKKYLIEPAKDRFKILWRRNCIVPANATITVAEITKILKPYVMKSIVRLTAVLFFAWFVSGCIKVVEAPVTIAPITGSWVLTSASEGDAYSWQSFYTGVENGSFYFGNDGTAQYTEGNITMQGNWYITNVNGGYYDEYGSFYNGNHQQLVLHLSDYYTHSTIDLSFDNVSFYGNQFVATYFNGNYIERYYFGRY